MAVPLANTRGRGALAKLRKDVLAPETIGDSVIPFDEAAMVRQLPKAGLTVCAAAGDCCC